MPVRTILLGQTAQHSERRHKVFVGTVPDEETELKRWEIQATQSMRKCFCPKNILSKQSISTDWFGSQQELILMMEMFHVPFPLSFFCINILWYDPSPAVCFTGVFTLTFYYTVYKYAVGLGVFFRVGVICSLGWSALSDSLYCSPSSLTP